MKLTYGIGKFTWYFRNYRKNEGQLVNPQKRTIILETERDYHAPIRAIKVSSPSATQEKSVEGESNRVPDLSIYIQPRNYMCMVELQVRSWNSKAWKQNPERKRTKEEESEKEKKGFDGDWRRYSSGFRRSNVMAAFPCSGRGLWL